MTDGSQRDKNGDVYFILKASSNDAGCVLLNRKTLTVLGRDEVKSGSDIANECLFLERLKDLNGEITAPIACVWWSCPTTILQ